MSRIYFTISGKQYSAVLTNSPLSEEIAAMCPFELTLTRGGDHEYYAPLPEKIKHSNEPPLYKGEKNKLYYFEGWNALSVVIKDCNTAPYEIYEVGSFEDDIAEKLFHAGRSVRISVEEGE